jgi:hypothetical protein
VEGLEGFILEIETSFDACISYGLGIFVVFMQDCPCHLLRPGPGHTIHHITRDQKLRHRLGGVCFSTQEPSRRPLALVCSSLAAQS